MDDYQKTYNERVRDKINLFRELIKKIFVNNKAVNIIISFVYVSLGNEIHPSVQMQADELKDCVRKMFPTFSVNVDFITDSELLRKNQQEAITHFSLPLASQGLSLGKNKDYIVLVKLSSFYDFITDNNNNDKLRSSFFEANIRDYQGDNTVNAEIRKTLEECTSEEFWWFNNGITILADNITCDTAMLYSIDSPKIVNGLQTANEIYNYFTKNKDKLSSDTRTLLIRLIVPHEDNTRDRIIFATNNQTQVQKISLRVTDPIHLEIEQYFKSRNLYYDRRKNFYKNQGYKSSDIISVSFLGQCMISILLQKPDSARARPSTILTNDTEYDILYQKNRDLDVFYKCAKIGKLVKDFIWKNYSRENRNNILFCAIYAIPAFLCKKTIISTNDIKNLDLSLISDDILSTVSKIVFSEYNSLGCCDKTAKNPELFNNVEKKLCPCPQVWTTFLVMIGVFFCG